MGVALCPGPGRQSTPGLAACQRRRPAEKVFEVIQKCHVNMTRHSDRVMTTVKIDDRRGATERLKGKVRSVEEKLGRELPKG